MSNNATKLSIVKYALKKEEERRHVTCEHKLRRIEKHLTRRKMGRICLVKIYK